MVPLSSMWLYETHTCFHNVVRVHMFIRFLFAYLLLQIHYSFHSLIAHQLRNTAIYCQFIIILNLKVHSFDLIILAFTSKTGIQQNFTLLYFSSPTNMYPAEHYFLILCLHTHFQIKCHPIILTFTRKHISNRKLSYYSCFNTQNTYPAEHYLTTLILTHKHLEGENNRRLE